MKYLAAITLAAGFCAAQSTSTVSLSNGVEVRITTDFGNPTGQQTLSVEMVRASGDSFYRVFWDQNHLAVFAYELGVQQSGDGKELIFLARPATTDFAARFPGADAGKPVPTLSSELKIGPLGSGESRDIAFFEIPGVGLRVSDSVEGKTDEDATAAAGQLHFAGLTVAIDGERVTPEPSKGAVTGRFAMFYLPGRGAYFFATEQQPDKPFVKAGSVIREKMTFTVENTNYDVTARAPILMNPDSGELWVFHDAAFRPEGNWTKDLRGNVPPSSAEEFFTAASDSLSWWLK